MTQLLDPYNLLPAIGAGELRALRQSTLGTADTCLKRLEYDLDPRIPYSTGEARAVGTAYHAGLDAYYSQRRRRQDNPDEADLEGSDAVEQVYVPAALEAFENEASTPGFLWQNGEQHARDTIVRMLNAYFEQGHYWPSQYKVLAVEVEWVLPSPRPGWAHKGTIDLVLQDPNGWHILDDHKSAGKRWRKGKELPRTTNQPTWYLHHWSQMQGGIATVAFVFSVMTYAGEFERRGPISYEPHLVEAVLLKAEAVCGLIEQGGPYPPNVGSFLCDSRWCDHWAYCPFGEAFDGGRQAEVPVAIRV